MMSVPPAIITASGVLSSSRASCWQFSGFIYCSMEYSVSLVAETVWATSLNVNSWDSILRHQAGQFPQDQNSWIAPAPRSGWIDIRATAKIPFQCRHDRFRIRMRIEASSANKLLITNREYNSHTECHVFQKRALDRMQVFRDPKPSTVIRCFPCNFAAGYKQEFIASYTIPPSRG
jgi:hypothetical protein